MTIPEFSMFVKSGGHSVNIELHLRNVFDTGNILFEWEMDDNFLTPSVVIGYRSKLFLGTHVNQNYLSHVIGTGGSESFVSI